MNLGRGLVIGVSVIALSDTACVIEHSHADTQLYAGFTLVDPITETLTPNTWLVVRGGLIEDMGDGASPEGDFAAVHDVSGLFAMAGLIDAHGHIIAGPQRITIEDGAPRIDIASGDEYSRSNAAIALAYGITTVRNPGGSTAAAARYDAMIASGEWIGPEALHAGRVIQPPPFVGESFAYPRTPEEWDAEAAHQAGAGMTYFKLYIGLTEDELAQGVAAAKAHGLIPIAHLNEVSWTRAVELGVEQLEHALPTSPALLEPDARAAFQFGPDFMTRWFELADYDGPLMQEMITALAASGAAVNLTLLVNQLVYHADAFETTFPEAMALQLEHMHPDFESMLENYEAMAAVPPEQLARGRAVWPKVLELARLMHEAGVRMMIGTDGPGGGPWYVHELENHVEAGIPIWEVLRMATSGNAEVIGLARTGRVAPGMEADLVFLTSDPTQDVHATGEVALVVTNGAAHTPDALLGIAREIAAAARARAAD